MSHPQLFLLFLCGLPLAAPLCCYTCVFPAISPMDCLKFPQECPAGQRCLASTAVGTRGSLRLVLYEKSCAIPSQCDLSGEKHTAGLNFTYHNNCCDTDLCNGAIAHAAPIWRGGALCILPILSLIQG
ncbi:prostate stem cell antigen [Salmo trutta]|uniref:Prostate stem cell antigen-like n=1 Tax=Salmo trutta TaxID=8032 RepID=A0A674EJA0_SALTR|nr:prostate stem cell antigen-like [Salmo trutta]